MKKFLRFSLLVLLVPTLLMTGCKKDNENPTSEFKILTDYLVASDMDLGDMIYYGDIKFVAGPPAIDADVAAYLDGRYVIDIRSSDAFTSGHITGAHNAAFADILTEAANAGAGDRLLIVCYSGQSACYATALLRLSGYPDAQALKWGMSGWNETFSTDFWDDNTGDVDLTNWGTGAETPTVVYDDPAISTGNTDGAAILAARVASVVAGGFKAVAGADVAADPSLYFINNYFSTTDFNGFGHFDGSYRINPMSLAEGSIQKNNPAEDVVTYCYTGQTSAVVTAYLRVLGYDAFSLAYGMNGINHSNTYWPTSGGGSGPNQWGVTAGPKDLSTE